MKVFISCDIEGIAGVVERAQTKYQGKDYERAREWMTGEVNAVVESALECGAKRILVNDAHGDMCNILIDKLNPKATLISGRHKPLVMMQGVEEGFDAVAFVGYHAKMGTPGAVLDHTMYGQVVHEYRINNRVFGETGVNALIAGYYKAPVALVCGDVQTTIEAKKFLGRVETVAIKKGITRYAAELLHPQEAVRRIKKSACRAFSNYKTYRPFRISGPLKLTLRFINSGMADEAAILPRAERVDGFQVSYRAKDIIELCRAADVMIALAAGTLPR
ncbi:MAG: M55 family metallopeptidase [Planctomycetota bacterium]